MPELELHDAPDVVCRSTQGHGEAARRDQYDEQRQQHRRAADEQQLRGDSLRRLKHRIVRNRKADDEIVEALAYPLGATEIVFITDNKRHASRLRSARLEKGAVHAAQQRRREIVDGQQAVGDIGLPNLTQRTPSRMRDESS